MVCRPHDKKSVAAAVASVYKINRPSVGCCLCLGENDDLAYPNLTATCLKCNRISHFECAQIPIPENPVRRGSRQVRPNKEWDCIFCLSRCQCCFRPLNVGSSSRPSWTYCCASCERLVCAQCTGIHYIYCFKLLSYLNIYRCFERDRHYVNIYLHYISSERPQC